MVLINGRLYVDCGRQPFLLTCFGKGKVNHSSVFSLIRLIISNMYTLLEKIMIK